MAYYLPIKEPERLVWLENFKLQFPDIAAQSNFSEAEIEAVQAACETLIFSIKLAREARNFSKACTNYRDTTAKSRQAKVEAVPEFTPPPAPATLAPANAQSYLQKIVQRLKLTANYSTSVGEILRILPKSVGRVSEENAKPTAKLSALVNSVVRIDWVKRGFAGVIVETMRADETTWTRLDRDMNSPFIDARPPLVAGKPETRRYRLIYIVDDQPYGNFSDIMTIVTTP